MWINIYMDKLNIKDIINKIKEMYELFEDNIVISISSNYDKEIVMSVLDIIVKRLKLDNIPIYIGPQFLEDGIIINGKFQICDELYIKTEPEKIAWYIKNYSLAVPINSIVLISKYLEIEPLIIKQKLKNSMDYYFIYEEKDKLYDIEKLVENDRYHFIRIKRKNNENRN